MIATHPFETIHETVLPLWSPSAQARQLAPDARAETFRLSSRHALHNIQLDNFSPTLARLLTILLTLTFLQTVLWKPEVLASLERAIPWTELARTHAHMKAHIWT
jgi:hypothetical protein